VVREGKLNCVLQALLPQGKEGDNELKESSTKKTGEGGKDIDDKREKKKKKFGLNRGFESIGNRRTDGIFLHSAMGQCVGKHHEPAGTVINKKSLNGKCCEEGGRKNVMLSFPDRGEDSGFPKVGPELKVLTGGTVPLKRSIRPGDVIKQRPAEDTSPL